MPFSFIEIEKEKSRVISYLFIFIILFYFLTAWLLLFVLENTVFSSLVISRNGLVFPSIEHSLIALLVAFVVGYLHWSMSTSNLIEKISLAVGAQPAEPKDTYHQYLKNIVDEVSVATGGRPIEARVIPDASMNAFAIEDFDNRAVIGVTEGLLSRLSRAQIEAVVAHEAGHITSGDCLSTTVTCSLAEIYEEALSKLGSGIGRSRGRNSSLLLLAFMVIGLMRFMSSLLRYFVSRQREYRADAISVRLTRDPLSLAEALKLISRNWRGAGSGGEKMQSIFIVNPKFDSLDEQENLFSDMFSTHPPVDKRIAILLDMAHLDEKTLEENLKNSKKASPVAKAEFTLEQPGTPKKWFVSREQKWLGPFLLDDLKKMEEFLPTSWIKLEGEDAVMPAYEDQDLLEDIFKQKDKNTAYESCPYCKTALSEISYEGAPILKCRFCEGAFVAQDKVSRILIRQDKTFDEDVVRLAQTMFKSKKAYRLDKIDPKNAWVINCPKCQKQMRRQFFVYSYPVEIDRCVNCSGIWFDKQELEVLQYIYENKDKFTDGIM